MRGRVCQPVLEKDPGLIITCPFKCSTLKVDTFFFFSTKNESALLQHPKMDSDLYEKHKHLTFKFSFL